MCYKVSAPDKDQLEGYFDKQVPKPGELFKVDDFARIYHADGFTMPALPISTTEEPRRVQAGIWKLIPHWVKSAADAKKYANTLNATCEDIFDKASYKGYIGKSRCLLWVNGFFEPHHPTPKETVPYYVRMASGEPFSLGGVLSNWVDPETGEVFKTFSVITTPANNLLARIHNEKMRMPLIIPAQERMRWLGDLSRADIEGMMQPLPDGILEGYPVSKLVYKKGVDANVPEVIEPEGTALR